MFDKKDTERNRLASVKEINKRNILRIVRDHGPISRSEISARLSISRPTVTTYIEELLGDGLLKEVGYRESKPQGGKRARLVAFNENSGYIIGSMLGVNRIFGVVSDCSCNIINSQSLPTERERGPEHVIENLIKSFRAVMRKSSIDRGRILGIGIGTSGLTDSKNGIVIFSPNMPGWHNVPLAKMVERKMHLRTYIDNECRIQAIAERYFGLGRNVDNFVCIETGVGIGSGVFIDGRIFRGVTQKGGEVGHTSIIENGQLCHCGNIGCWETLASTQRLEANIIEGIKSGEQSILATKVLDGQKLDFEDILRAYKHGDELVIKKVDEMSHWLGIGIANVLNSFDPELVIIHGKAIKFGDRVLERIRKTVAQHSFPLVNEPAAIRFSELGDEVGIIGAVSMVLDRVFQFSKRDMSKEFLI